MQLILLIFFLSFVSYCHINKYHRKVPLLCKEFCLATQAFQTVISGEDVLKSPILLTKKKLQYIPYNQNYLLYKKIAQGASAQVYLAQDQITEQFEIVKEYFTVEDKTQFQEENYIMHQLGYDMRWSLSPVFNETISIHPFTNVKTLADVQTTDRQLKVIMYKLIKQLKRAHDKGIIHSDIKSENILVDVKAVGNRYITEKMKIKLIDWNLAAFYYQGKKYNRASGTPPFKAPELVVQAEFYTPAVDVWSLGTVMFENIAHKTLIPADFDTEIYEMVKVFGFQKFIDFYNKLGGRAEPLFMHQIIESQNFTATFEENISNPKFNDEQRKFIKKLLTIEPWNRPSCKELLKDQYFNDIRKFDAPMSQKTKIRDKQRDEMMKKQRQKIQRQRMEHQNNQSHKKQMQNHK